MLRVGIVGLPNVGKSTLFNALTKSRKAEMANYPFCTIEPNIGIVSIPDERLDHLAKFAKTEKIVPAAIEFFDIAGLVAGASKGEGLGNQFLSNIREVDAIAHVVRCFDDSSIIHNIGSVDPVRDIEIINTELILADLQSADSQLQKNQKKIKSKDSDAIANVSFLEKLIEHLNTGSPAHSLVMTEEEKIRAKTFQFLSSKPVIYACNVSENDLSNPENNKYLQKVREYLKTNHEKCTSVPISAKLEADLSELSKEEAQEFLSSFGVSDSGFTQFIKSAYELLGLGSYFTAGEKEARAWTFKKGMTAPECAGVIHTDFEKGFIKAEVTSYKDLIQAGSYHRAKELGKTRLEGKEYIFADGDVAIFRFQP